MDGRTGLMPFELSMNCIEIFKFRGGKLNLGQIQGQSVFQPKFFLLIYVLHCFSGSA
jgi:hypothetical protein